MFNFYYVSGALGSPELLATHQKSVELLLTEGYSPKDLEMLCGHHGVYSLRLNKGERLIFTTIEVKGERYLLLLDYLPTHDYHRCRYLNRQILRDYVVKEQEAAEASAGVADEELEFESVNDDVRGALQRSLAGGDKSRSEGASGRAAYYYKSRLVILNPTQESSLDLRLPAIVNGVAGSGKSCVALAALAKAAVSHGDERPIWYVTQSRELVEEMRAQWATRVDKDIAPVEFLTYREVLERQAGRELGTEVGQVEFSLWYYQYVSQKEKIAGVTHKTLAGDYPDAIRAYQECRICSGYTKKAYCDLGRRQSRLDKGSRELVYEAYEVYKEYMASKGQIDPAFYEMPQGEESPCLLVVDEAQDLSTLALSGLHGLSEGQILFCIDSHQRVEDDLSVGPFLKERFRISDEQCVKLDTTYRCPAKVIGAANEVIRLKYQLSGGKEDKDELPRVSGMGGDDRVLGSLYHMDEESLFKNELIKQWAKSSAFAVVTTPERVEELKSRLGTPLVFTPKTIKGLEYDMVATVGLYEKDLFKGISEHLLEVDDETPSNRAKAGKEKSQFITPLHQIYVAYTRAKRTLIICEPSTRHTDALLGRLSDLWNKEPFSDASFSISDPEVWLQQARLQVKVGNRGLAQDIYCSKINPDRNAFHQWLATLDAPQPTSFAAGSPVASATAEAAPAIKAPSVVSQELKRTPVTPSRNRPTKPKKEIKVTPVPPTKKAGVLSSEQREALALYQKFDANRFATAVGLFDAAKLLIEKCIPQAQGVSISLLEFILQNEEAKKVFCHTFASDASVLTKLVPLVLNPKYKPHFLHKGLPDKALLTVCNSMHKIYFLEGCAPCYAAAQYGYVDTLYALKELDTAVDFNKANKEGVTPCHIAAWEGKSESLRVLVELGADVNAVNKDGVTSCHFALQKGYIHVLNMLVEQLGAEVNKFDNRGRSLFHQAAEFDYVKALRPLQKLGADINQADKQGNTPCHIAARYGHVEALRTLYELGADFNKANNNGATPFHIAAEYGRCNVLDVLCELYPSTDVNQGDKYGDTPSCLAARSGHVEALRTLHKLGADLNKSNNDGATPFHIAAEYGQLNVLCLLRELYPSTDVNQGDKYGDTPSCLAARHGQVAALRELKGWGADVNQGNWDGDTPCHAAVEYGQVAALRELKNLDADVNQVNKKGYTPCQKAAEVGQIGAICVLSQLGADLNKADNLGATPAYTAAEYNQKNAIEALHRFGADLNKANRYGATPLFIAAQKGYMDIVEVLVKYKVNRDQKFVSTQELLREFALSHGEGVIERMEKKIASCVLSGQEKEHIALSARDIAEVMGHSQIVKALNDAEEACLPKGLFASNGFFKEKSSRTSPVEGEKSFSSLHDEKLLTKESEENNKMAMRRIG